MAITIRPLTIHDVPTLWEVLYHALHVPPGGPALPRDIVNHLSLSRYVTDGEATGLFITAGVGTQVRSR